MTAPDEPSVELPRWAVVGERRRRHIARVTALLDSWSNAMALAPAEREAWHDAGRLHDALRDADDDDLRALAGDLHLPVDVLHGPAAAAKLEADGETRSSLIAAVRWHTLGHPTWDRVGQALYMADYLEPGRSFSRRDRVFLADRVPTDFDGVFRQVVRQRLEWSLREGHALHHETTALWNAVR